MRRDTRENEYLKKTDELDNRTAKEDSVTEKRNNGKKK